MPNDNPGPGRPPSEEETATAYIHLRCLPSRKTTYVRAANMTRQTLAAFAFDAMDKAAKAVLEPPTKPRKPKK